jgi:hypothetical protein
MWSHLGFCLKWWLLLFPASVAAFVALAKTAYPWTALLALIASVFLFLFDYARHLDAMRPVGWRVDVSWPRKLWKVFVGTVTVVVIFCVFGEAIAIMLLVALAVGVSAALAGFFAERFGWGAYGRLERYLNRPPFVDRRLQGSRDPTETRPS